MYLLLNKYAAGGNAEKKWGQIKDVINQKFDNLNVIELHNHILMEQVIKEAIETGDKNFILAGGDGTINYFINKLIPVLNENKIKDIKIGVLGIGSSNDFCKPFSPEIFINGIPCKINFDKAQLRDVGVIKYKSGKQFLHKFFLLNASVGITAEANNNFNNPDRILHFLKKHSTSMGILFVALKTILSYRNFETKITFNSYETYSFSISNLSIIKNPHFSGDLSYPSEADYQNGLYDIYLAYSMNKFDLINLLKSLSRKVFPKNEKTKYCRTPKIKITVEDEFKMEFDGEVIKTNYAEFSILKKYIKICNS
jgi:diacylglycerol kinase (ATP)